MRSITNLAGALAGVTLWTIVAASARHDPPDPAPQPAGELPVAHVEPGPPPAAVIPKGESPVVQRAVEGAPLSLTASDGSGLALASLTAKAVVEGPLAFTELHMAFDNPEDRVREGTFKIVLPQGASVGRLAMKIDGVWQEGEIVKKERARVAYEDALHHKQDPALMEKGAGNELTARVFPIPPRGRKEIVVSYTQELTTRAPYALPLRGLPQLGLLDVSIAGIDGAPLTLHRERFTPTEDVVAPRSKATLAALRSGNLAVVRVRPVPEAMPDPVTAAVVLVDTSASRALGLESELQTLRETLQRLADRQGERVSITVAAFDQDVQVVYRGDARSFGDTEIEALRARRALGASNVQRALEWARGESKTAGAARVVLVTDSVATAGEQDASTLAATAASLRDAGATRLDIVAVGGLRDDALAHKLVTAGLSHDGVVADASDGATTIVRRLESGTKSDVAVAIEGATWSYPTHLNGVQPGDEALVYAEIPEGAPLRVRVGGGGAMSIDASMADRPLLERGWAGAKIASLEAEERDLGKSAERTQRIVDLSVKHRVLSAYTSLLVLESQADYARFDIDRRALSDILTVRDGKLAWSKREDGDSLPPNKPWNESGNGHPLHHFLPKSLSPGAAAEPQATATPATSMTGALAGNGPEARDDAPSAEGFGAGGMALDRSAAAPAPRRREVDAEEREVTAAPAPAVPQPMAAAAPAAPATAPRDQTVDGLSAVGRLGALSGPVGHGSGGGAMQAPAARAAQNGFGRVAEEQGVDPYTGKMKQVKARLAAHDPQGALTLASAWEAASPGDVLSLVALGESAEATHDPELASRAYGSIIDLFPSRADLRRFAGERLEHVQGANASELAIDTFDKARRDRPDHPESHRLAAYARLRRGEYAAAFDILEAGASRNYPENRFRGVDRILREDLGLVAAAWMKAEPSRRKEILDRLARAGGTVEDGPSIRFVLNWETDANDVDFHIEDAEGGHAFYGSPHLPSGGDLYADVTTGYGPECFTIRASHGRRAGPYKLRAHYYSRGPMGYGMGKLEIVDHDGHGGLKFEEREFVVMADHAFVDLGTVKD